jgi:hypothetical protein
LGLDTINHDHFKTKFFNHFEYEEDVDFTIAPTTGYMNIVVPAKWHVRSWEILSGHGASSLLGDACDNCRLGVHGRALMLWDSTDWPDGSHTKHEYHHLDIARDVYRDMAEFIFPYTVFWAPKRQVDCLRSTLDRLVKAYDQERRLENIRYHVNGGYSQGSPAWELNKEWLDQLEGPITAELNQAKTAFSDCKKH